MAATGIKLERLGDLCPQIENCRGGIQREGMMGQLNSDELAMVKNIYPNRDLKNQDAFTKTCTCSLIKESAEIAYFPQTGEDMQREIHALCLNKRCSFFVK